jgi:hypothetical protein
VALLRRAEHAGRAPRDVGHLVELGQLFHNQFADVAGFNLAVETIVDLALDRRNCGLDLIVADRPLPAGLLQPSLDFRAVEGHSVAVFFDHLDRYFFDALERSIAAVTRQALAAAADRQAVLTGARINHAVVVNLAIGASHANHYTGEPRKGEWAAAAGAAYKCRMRSGSENRIMCRTG